MQVIRFLRMDGTYKVPKDYEKEFRRADLTFLHQCVYNPTSKQLVHLTALPADGLSENELNSIGSNLEVTVATGIATGDLDPCTHLPIMDIGPPPSNFSPMMPTTRFVTSKKKVERVKTGPLDLYLRKSPFFQL